MDFDWFKSVTQPGEGECHTLCYVRRRRWVRRRRARQQQVVQRPPDWMFRSPVETRLKSLLNVKDVPPHRLPSRVCDRGTPAAGLTETLISQRGFLPARPAYPSPFTPAAVAPSQLPAVPLREAEGVWSVRPCAG